MTVFSGWAARGRAFFSDNKGPWGAPPSGGGDEPPSGDGPTGPWGEQPKRRPSTGRTPVSSLDDFLKKSRGRFGGGPGGGMGFTGRPDRSLITWAIIAVVVLWLLFTTMHRILPGERGVVTRFGRYSHTLTPGIGLTLPSRFDRVQ